MTSCFDDYVSNELNLLYNIGEDDEVDEVDNDNNNDSNNIDNNNNENKATSFNKNQSNNIEKDVIVPLSTTSYPTTSSNTQQPSSTLPILNLSNDTNNNNEIFATILNELLSTNKSINFIEAFANLSESSLAVEEFDYTTSTERLINEYFDTDSLNFGKIINKKGAGKFQNEILKDTFSVTGIKKSQGAIIFEGKFINSKSSEEFSKIVKEKYDNSRFNGKYNYIITQQEVYPNLDKGIQQAALDSFLGSTPSVIIYPSTWNTSIISNTRFNPIRKFFRSILSSVSVISTLVYAAQATHLFDESIPIQSSTDILSPTSDYFLPMVLAVVSIQYFSSVVESVVGSFKNIEIDSLILPSFSLFNFGLRSTYITPPMNRSALFDVAVSGILASLISSIIAIFIGFQLTEIDTPAMIAQYPTVPLSLLKTNTIVSQLLSSHYGDNVLNIVKNPLNDAIGNLGALGVIAGNNANDVITSVVPTKDVLVHLHWLVIVGSCSFIGNLFQLLPFDNSAGAKLVYAALGRESFILVSGLFGLSKIFALVPLLLNFNGIASSELISNRKLFLDYIILSQLVSNEQDTQVPVDNISDITFGRKMLFYCIVSLFAFAFFPIESISNDVSSLIDNIILGAKNGIANYKLGR
eukprot:gene12481-16741_t